MEKTLTSHLPDFSKWAFETFDFNSFAQSLRKEGFDEQSIEAQIQALKKVLHEKREKRGFSYLVAGSLIGFSSCIMSIVNPFPMLHEIILYGFTTAAAVIILLGLYFIVE